MRWWSAWLMLACLAGCDSSPATQLVIAPEHDAQQPPADGSAMDAMQEEAEVEADARDAAATSAAVIVGMGPTVQGVDGGAEPAGQLDAVLLALASGARGITLQYDWEALDAANAGAQARWEQMGAIASVVRQQKRSLLLSIRAVDATLDRRPAQLQKLSWDSPLVDKAIKTLVAEVFKRVGTELRYLSLGFEVDRFVEANPTKLDEFRGFALEAMKFANTEPTRKSSTTSVTWSMAGWRAEQNPSTWAPELVEASEVVMVSYAPMTETFRATPADGIPAELDAILVAAAGKPLVLTDVAYPSSDLAGSSEQVQGEFVGRLLEEVTVRRNAISFVGWGALHDPASAWCEGRAAASGHPSSDKLYVYWCSTGLRTRQGDAKASFDAFRTGAAGLMDP